MKPVNDNSDAREPDQGKLARMMSATEGKVLLAGLGLLATYLTAVGLTSLWSSELFHSLWQMTLTHVLGGRAAGLSHGYNEQMGFWVVVGANLAIETFMVLLFYPLFVFSYNKLIVIKPLEETMARARRAAESGQAKVTKWGIPGLLVFVWFPFWMTGPLVGSVIGFLIGLKTWTNLCVVLAGTGLAILCWGVILQQIHDALARLGPYVPVFFVG
ncbi:MAG: small multi-drug export protein, partial [Candidatus Brocadiaceae bacterium]